MRVSGCILGTTPKRMTGVATSHDNDNFNDDDIDTESTTMEKLNKRKFGKTWGRPTVE